ncbi:hypothetical protein IWW37_001496, partial [Coemansia sp. RSA 2050]
ESAVEAVVEQPVAEAVAEEPVAVETAEEPVAVAEEPAGVTEEPVAVAEELVAGGAESVADIPATAEPSVEVIETASEETAERAIEEPATATAELAAEPVAEETVAEIATPAVEEATSEAPVVNTSEAVVEQPTEAIAEPAATEPTTVSEEVASAEMPVANEETSEEPAEVGSPIDEYEDLSTSATEARDGTASADSGLSDGVEDFVLVSAGDATGSPVPECQDAPSGAEIIEDALPEPVSAGDNDSGFMAARSLSVPSRPISDDMQEVVDPAVEEEPLASANLAEDVGVVAEPVAEEPSLAETEAPAAVADVDQPLVVESIATADEPKASTAPSDPGFIVIKDRETTVAPPAAATTIGDLLNIDTIRSFNEVDSVLYPSETQADGDASLLPEANVTTPSYVMHYPESLFGDTNSITPGLITMDDLHTAQKASAVVGVSAINATSVGRKSRDSGHHHHHHLLGESEASVSQRMKRFIAGKRSDGPGRSSSDAEPVSPVKGNVAGLFSQYRSSRTSMETKRASATTSALESVAASELDLTEATRGTRSATVHGGSFEDELAKHGHTIPGSFPVENVAGGPGSDGEGVNLAETEHAGDGNTSENEGGKDRHRRHTILGVFKRMFR